MAVPHPEEELRRLANALNQGELGGCTLLLGRGQWFKDRAVRGIAQWAGDSADVRILAQDGKAAEVIQDLRTRSLFAGRKVCVVRGSEFLRDGLETVATGVGKLPAQSHLVLDLEKPPDGRTKAGKELRAHATSYEFRDLYDRPYRFGADPTSAELVVWLVDRARRKGLRMAPATAWFLTQTTGTDPAELDAELDRLHGELGEQSEPLTPEQLRARVHVGFTSSQFELAEAVLGGDRQAALRSLNAIEREGLADQSGRRMEAGALFPVIASWLHRSLRNGARAHRLMATGLAPQQAAAKVGVIAFQDRFLAALGKRSLAWFENALTKLFQCELRMRLTSEEPVVLLERLVVELTREAAAAHAGGRR